MQEWLQKVEARDDQEGDNDEALKALQSTSLLLVHSEQKPVH